MNKNILKHLTLFTALAGGLLAHSAFSASFQLRENNSSLLGHANAGSAAIQGDVKTMANNPATMISLNNHAVAFSAAAIAPYFKFKPESAQSPSYGAGVNADITGNDGSNGGQMAVVPAFYLMWNVNAWLKAGINVTVPFGLRTEYNNNWIGRYHGINSDLKTYNINPALALKINNWLSVGAGVQIMRVEATLSSAISAGNVGGTGDVISNMTGGGWGVGANAGLLFKPREGTCIGLAYRSHVRTDIDGSVSFDARQNLGATLNAGTAKEGGKAETNVTLPETITLSLSQEVNPKWTVLADLQWTHWSRFRELRIRFPDGSGTGANANDKVEKFGYTDSWFLAAGARYKACDKLTLKFGVAFDSTPTKVEYRNVRIPDENRFWVAGGLEYNSTENLKLSLDLVFLKMADAKIDQRGETVGYADKTGKLRGTYESHAYMLGVSAHYKF